MNTSEDPTIGASKLKESWGIGEFVDIESRLLAVRGSEVLERNVCPC